jgi:hypothetical protein
MREEMRREIQRKISESFDRPRQAAARPIVDEEKLRKPRDHFVELLFKSAERQLGE